MDQERFKTQLRSRLEEWDLRAKVQEISPSEGNVKTMQESFNKFIQEVLDEIQERKSIMRKLLCITAVEEVLEEIHGAPNIYVEQLIRVVQERALLMAWGSDKPCDPFHELDKDK